MRKHRLLELDDEGGAAVVESVAAMLLLLMLVLGVIQVAFFLYSRNVVRASAHEGARAALELGRTPEEASLVAERTVRRAVGGVVGDMEVRTETRSVDGTSRISVFVRAEISGFGPFPFPAEMVSIAHVSRPTR